MHKRMYLFCMERLHSYRSYAVVDIWPSYELQSTQCTWIYANIDQLCSLIMFNTVKQLHQLKFLKWHQFNYMIKWIKYMRHVSNSPTNATKTHSEHVSRHLLRTATCSHSKKTHLISRSPSIPPCPRSIEFCSMAWRALLTLTGSPSIPHTGQSRWLIQQPINDEIRKRWMVVSLS